LVLYVGKPETASTRLNLTQAFNSPGTTLAPLLGVLILSAVPLAIEQLRQLLLQAMHLYRMQQAASVKMPYIVISIALVLLAVAIARLRQPKIEQAKGSSGKEYAPYH
jgi:FHS family L-fucose permease-like MFS transporter